MNSIEQDKVDKAAHLEHMGRTKGWEIYCDYIDDAIMRKYVYAENLSGKGKENEVEAVLLEIRGLKAAGKIFAQRIEEANRIKAEND